MANKYASEIRTGDIISYKEGDFFKVSNWEHIKSGKGGAKINLIGKKCKDSTTVTFLLDVAEIVYEATLIYVKHIISSVNVHKKTLILVNADSFETIEINILDDERNRFLQEGSFVFFTFADNVLIEIKYNEAIVKVFNVISSEDFFVLDILNQPYKIKSNGKKISIGDSVLLDLSEKNIVLKKKII